MIFSTNAAFAIHRKVHCAMVRRNDTINPKCLWCGSPRDAEALQNLERLAGMLFG